MATNRWLKRIFSLEFAGLCVAIVAAYFAYVPIKSYFVDDECIAVHINNRPIRLVTDKENIEAEAIKILAFTQDNMRIPFHGLINIENTSNKVVKGLNVDVKYYWGHTISYITPGWEYTLRGIDGEVRNKNHELQPYEVLNYPFDELSYTYEADGIPEETFYSTLTSITYEGCEGKKMFLTVISVIRSSYEIKSNSDNLEERRNYFDREFTKISLREFYDSYKSDPNKYDGYIILTCWLN